MLAKRHKFVTLRNITMEISVEQVASLLGGKVEGDGTARVNRLEKIEEATPGSIAFLANPKYLPYIYSTSASAVIVKSDFAPEKPVKGALIRVDDPYSAFARLLEEYEKMTAKVKTGIEQPSFQHESASYGEQVYLGAFSYLGENVKVGKNTKIYPQVYLGDHVEVGDNTILYPGVKVYANCKIGSNCVLHSGVVVGSDGFGFAPQADGTYKSIPQTGNVIIEDNVDIGANTTIDCATMGSTVIRKGAKIDNLVQIAHNVEVGKNTAIASQAGLSGSAKIGENCQIGGQAGITGHLSIANKTIIGPQAGVPKTISQEGKVWFGSPIMEHKDFLRASVILRNLPNLIERVKELEKKL
ncbi:UDP-3-O-acylglucosamine N-acyltransferase [Roseivirga thermotolerans]|uniref:UDP-3-O-acylglucosamine N-acyltransferase n=2 Tax=Roseivirgaceae TaxID=2762306 RepID=A0ABQ3I6P6_9BACT|nr:UDP-3-O-acylglucosamine N-acyltransferase [Roseivirga thermotolerans]|tara:strand:+ start:22860 stop:23927 length:1068 start_codon:yes stop_codon:yes gene_type:complete